MQLPKLELRIGDGEPVVVQARQDDMFAAEDEFGFGANDLQNPRTQWIWYIGWHAAYRCGQVSMTWLEFKHADGVRVAVAGADVPTPTQPDQSDGGS